MTKREPSPNFKSLLHVLIDKNPPKRDKYISCLAYLPTIREDIPYLIHYLSTENDINQLKKYIVVIFELFSTRKPTDFNFQKEEIDSMISSIILMNHRLELFEMCRDYAQILLLLLSFYPQRSEEQLLQIRRLMQQSINIEVVYSVIAMHFPNIRDEAFRFIVKDNDSHLRNPIPLFSFSNMFFAYKSQDNVPMDLKNYVDPKRVIDGLNSAGQNEEDIEIIDQPNKKNNSKTIAYYNCVDNPSKHGFVLYFLYSIQEFYPPDTVMFLIQPFFNSIIFQGIIDNEQSRNLVADLISVMPASNVNPNFNIESQITAILVQMTKYITDYNSDLSQKVFTFAKKRENDQSFVNTMVIMSSNPDRYTAAIQIGLGTNMFGNSNFVEGCFPAKVTDTKIFAPMLKAIPFLLQKNFIQEINIKTILTSIFSILSNPYSRTGDILKLALNSLQELIKSHFTKYILFSLVDNINHVLTDCFIPIIDLLIKNRNELQNIGSQQFLTDQRIKKYFCSVAVVACSIESSTRNEQQKLTLLNFLNLLNGNKLYEIPETDDRQIIVNFWKSMENKFTIIYVVCNYVFTHLNSETTSFNMLNHFYSTICSLFDGHERFSVIVSVLPYNENTRQAIEKANSLIDNHFNLLENKNMPQQEKDRLETYFVDSFVSFYRTRLFVDQITTLNKFASIIKKEKLKLVRAYLSLITVLCHQLNYQEFLANSAIDLGNQSKDENTKRKEYNNLCEKLGKFLEETKVSKLSDHIKVFQKVQIEARNAVYEASRNPDIILTDSLIKDLISFPFFFNSYSYLLRKLRNKENTDAKVAADAWINHLRKHDHDHILNEEISKEIISTISDNKQIAITSIVSQLITEVPINDNEDEDDEIYSINDQLAYPALSFLEYLAINGCSKNYASAKQDPTIIIFFSRFCYSKIDKVRICAFRFIMNYFAVNFPYVDKATNPKYIDPLYYYQNKHTGADRVLVFLSLFNRVFAMRKVLAGRVFEEISKKKMINIYHVLLCKSIVDTNFLPSPNYMNFNVSIDEDSSTFYHVNNDMNINNNMRMNNNNLALNQQMMNQQNQFQNQNLNSSFAESANADPKDQLTNDEMISNDTLYTFSKRIFVTAKTSFEAQEVMKLIAIKDIDKFITFLMSKPLTDFMRCVVKRIMYSTVLRNKFIDSFICYILRGGVKIGTNKELNENDIKVTNEEVQFLNVITLSDSSGELKYINSGKLILIIVMLIGISYRSKKRKQLKKNTLLSETLVSIISPNYNNRKQIDKLPKFIHLNTDDYNCYSQSLKAIAKELMNMNAARFRDFCVCCKNCVKLGIDCVSCSIGVLMIHLSQAFTDYGSSTTIEMKDYLWSIVSKAINRKSTRNRRLFARILNQELNNPIIQKIDNISKSHIFHAVLESLAEELDDFKSDAVEIVCTFLSYVQSMNKEDHQLREQIILNLQKAFAVTSKDKEQRRKEIKEKLKDKDEKPKESKFKSPFAFIFKDKDKDKNKETNNNININTDDDKSEEFDFSILVYNASDENKLRLNQSVLSAIKLLASTASPSDKLPIFGSWKLTKLSIVDVAAMIVRGTKIEQQLALDIFMMLFRVQTPEDAVKRFILNMGEEDFNEFCQRIIPSDFTKVDSSWIEILIWVYQSFQGHRAIDPNLKQQLFSIAMQISCIEGHRCRELALDAMNIFSR